MATVFIDDVPLVPAETLEFAANPDRFLDVARDRHPWLARFSQGYIVHGYKAVADLLADDVNLLSGFGPIIDFYGVRGTMWARFMDEMVLAVSGETHTRLRASVAHAFTPSRANQERELMRRVVGDLLDKWVPKGEFDFAQFAAYFPVSVICGILGVSPDFIPRIHTALENQLTSLSLNPAAKPGFMAGWEVLWEFADTLVKDREVSGQFDEQALLDTLIAAKNAGRLDDDELRFMVLTVLVAGYDTSKNQLTMTMLLLLDRPDIYQRCAQDIQYCRKVVEESLRHSAIASPYRSVARDFTYDGYQFNAGDTLVLAAPLGNRDPAVYPGPSEFDPMRENVGRNIAFGRGAHICLGQFIARNQLQEGLHLIARRIRDPKLAGEIEWRPFLGAWGPKSLPIRFTPG